MEMMHFAHRHQPAPFPHGDVGGMEPMYRFPVPPVAIGSQQAVFSPTAYIPATLVQYGPAASAGYFPQPVPVTVKQHNPYALVGKEDVSDFGFPTAEYSQHPHDTVMDSAKYNNPHHAISTEELLAHQGTLVELSRTAPGSSFIQAALKEGSPLRSKTHASLRMNCFRLRKRCFWMRTVATSSRP
jgi:hypothetical protein